MRTINIHAAKTHLSRLVEQAAAGEEIVIAKAGKPMARLAPLSGSQKPADAPEWARRFHEWAARRRPAVAPLSDEAISRESIYPDRS
jgi:prevent-host-death family protein